MPIKPDKRKYFVAVAVESHVYQKLVKLKKHPKEPIYEVIERMLEIVT